MKKIIYILILALVLLGFIEQTSGKTPDKNTNIYIQDKSKYDKTFIKGLTGYNGQIQLIDNYIIVDKDTAYFPESIPLNKPIVFQAANENLNFELIVTRTNLTNLNYKFKLSDTNNKIVDHKSGKVVLRSMFFLPSEIDEDDLTGIGYGCSEYFGETGKCSFVIRIGINENQKLVATFSYCCHIRGILYSCLDICPTLRTE